MRKKYVVGKFELKIKKSKTGRGVFAMQDIPKGSCIIEYIGKVVPNKDIEKNTTKYLFEISKNVTIDGNIPKNKARYINHSCKPNCEADGPEGHVYILAIKNIKDREELTYDYGEEYFDEYLSDGRCKCQKCSKIK